MATAGVVSDWLDTVQGQVVTLAAILVALGVIWRQFLQPLIRGSRRLVRNINKWGESWDVLEDIAAEFRPNHGSSLRDQVDMLQRITTDSKGYAAEAKVTAIEATEAVKENRSVLAGFMSDVHEQLARLSYQIVQITNRDPEARTRATDAEVVIPPDTPVIIPDTD